MSRKKNRRTRGILSGPLRRFARWLDRPVVRKQKRKSLVSRYLHTLFRARGSKGEVKSTRTKSRLVALPRFRLPIRYFKKLSGKSVRWLIGSTEGTALPVELNRTGREKPLVWTNFINPINWFSWPIFFVASFAITRPFRSLGPALFSIAILFVVIFLLAQQQYQGGKNSRVQLYQRLLTQAVDRKDFETALICSKTLIDLQPNEERFLLERARIEKELGNKDYSQQLMYRLALVRKSGLAALLLAEEKFQLDQIKDWSVEDHQLFRGLMLIAVNELQGPNADVAKVRFATYFSAINANAEALRFLEDVIPNNPQYALSVAELAMKLNDQAKLRTVLPVAKNYYETKLKGAPENQEWRLLLARTFVIADQLDNAIQLLYDGIKLGANEKYQNALGEALAYKAARLSSQKSSPELVVTRMNLVHEASKMAPNNPVVVESLIEMLIEYRQDTNQEIAVLREAAFQGLSPEAVHFVRGTIALMDNNIADAQTHLQLAADGGLNLPGILNNLAVAIASSKEGNLQQALSLADEAIRQMEHPYLFETRGQILYKMGKYQDCILDLEKGLQAEPLVKDILPKLSDAYRQLGNDQLAAEYEDKFKKLESSPTIETTPEPELPQKK